jgi:3-dehydroquinate synthase
MTDAALGGKTAVNAEFLKNSAGTFYPAEEVIIIPEFQTTLAKQDLQNGLVEMLKLWFINSALPDIQPDNDGHIRSRQILEYAKAKLDICAKDPFDRNDRRLLNLGHTFGHILESVSRYRIPHGNAVAHGMLISLRLSHLLGFYDKLGTGEMEEIIRKHGFGLQLREDLKLRFLKEADRLVRQDKKATQKGLTLILFRGYRQVFIHENVAIGAVTDLVPQCI